MAEPLLARFPEESVAKRPALPPDQIRRLHALDFAIQSPHLFLGTPDGLEDPLEIRQPITPDQLIEIAKRFDAYLLDGH